MFGVHAGVKFLFIKYGDTLKMGKVNTILTKLFNMI